MSMFEIEKNIPIGRKGGLGRNPIYPFAEMGIGDSFFSACDDVDAKRMCSAACVYAKNHPGFKFSVRKVDGGYRVWRVEWEPKGDE